MSKFPKIEPRMLESVANAVEACWKEGSPVVGQSAESWREVARVAIRRARSFDRRGISKDELRAQVHDIAQGLVAAYESDPNLVGPLIMDYEHVAEKALDAFRQFDTGSV